MAYYIWQHGVGIGCELRGNDMKSERSNLIHRLTSGMQVIFFKFTEFDLDIVQIGALDHAA